MQLCSKNSEALTDIKPTLNDCLYQTGELALSSGNLSKAAKFADALLEHSFNGHRALALKGRIAVKQGDSQLALTYLAEMRKCDPPGSRILRPAIDLSLARDLAAQGFAIEAAEYVKFESLRLVQKLKLFEEREYYLLDLEPKLLEKLNGPAAMQLCLLLAESQQTELSNLDTFLAVIASKYHRD